VGRLRALGLAAAALALATAAQGAAPPRPTGGLAFGPATLVDPLRVLTSPVLHVDPAGTLWVTGRGGGLLRSTDGGDSFRSVTPPPVGPGAADVVTAGGTVVVAAEEGGTISVAASDDGGSTWRRGTVGSLGQASRPWLAADGSTVFLAVSTGAGTEIHAARAAELSFADAGAPGPESTSTRCGRPVFDPARRMLHLACARGNLLELTTGQVRPGQATGISFVATGAAVTPAGPVGGPLPSLAVDAVGHPYVVWIDAATSALYVARLGSPPLQVNGAGADVAALPAAVGGAPGTIAVAYLGAAVERDPNALPDPRTDPRGAAGVRWYGFTALVTGLDSGPVAVVQQRTTAKPVAFGRVCTTCPTDPILGDALGAALEPGTGALHVALPDASAPRHAAQPVLARQLTGPTALGRSILKPRPANGVVDGVDVPGAPQLDLTKVELQQVSPAILRVRMTLAGAATPAPPPGAAGGIWMTRFQILSRGQAGEAAYRSVFAAAIATGGEPRFVAGEIDCADACHPAAARPAAGAFDGRAVLIDVNLSALSTSVPLEGDLLYNVSGLTFAGDASGNPTAVVDSLASFDYRLDQRIGPTTGRGRRITLRGTIPAGGGRRAAVAVDVRTNRTGTVAYRDVGARVVFRSTRITRVTLRRGVATISGTGLNATRRISFVATIVDRTRRRDSFAIRLSSGYRGAGQLLTGSVRIR
jgi:hypothetical protein